MYSCCGRQVSINVILFSDGNMVFVLWQTGQSHNFKWITILTIIYGFKVYTIHVIDDCYEVHKPGR